MELLILHCLSLFYILSGAFIGAFNQEKYSVIIAANLITVGLLCLHVTLEFLMMLNIQAPQKKCLVI